MSRGEIWLRVRVLVEGELFILCYIIIMKWVLYTIR